MSFNRPSYRSDADGPPQRMKPSLLEGLHWGLHRMISRQPVPYGQRNEREREEYCDDFEYQRRMDLYHAKQMLRRYGSPEAAGAAMQGACAGVIEYTPFPPGMFGGATFVNAGPPYPPATLGNGACGMEFASYPQEYTEPQRLRFR